MFSPLSVKVDVPSVAVFCSPQQNQHVAILIKITGWEMVSTGILNSAHEQKCL